MNIKDINFKQNFKMRNINFHNLIPIIILNILLALDKGSYTYIKKEYCNFH